MHDPAGQGRDAAGGGRSPKRSFVVTPDLEAGLYVVSTPIGNLRDITLRALDILASADLICAEDTRTTAKLLAAYSISTPLRPYHDHSKAAAREEIVKLVGEGKRIALVSDAGTPLISDPGFKLVREMRNADMPVFPIPGASSAMAAIVGAGLPTDRFLFAGFPPQKAGPRRRMLQELREVSATLVFFEGPSRLAASLADMTTELGDRDAVVARELTKKFEEFRSASLSELAGHYETQPPRGEVVVLVAPPDAASPSAEQLDEMITQADPNRPLKEIAAEIAETLGLRRREVYERALELRGK